MIDKIEIVEEILGELGLEKTPRIFVFNKCDLGSPFSQQEINNQYKAHSPVFVSAIQKAGLEKLKATIRDNLFG